MAIRIILIDDAKGIHDAVAIALKSVQDIILVGEAFRGEDALQLCEISSPDLVLMDIVLPGISGPETTRMISEQFPNIRILGISSYREHALIRAMLDSGAAGYVLKDAIADELVDSIRAAIHGRFVFSTEIGQLILFPHGHQDFGLTEREICVLKLIAEGHNDPQIAQILGVTKHTVRFHLKNILHKMNVETRSQAMILAGKHNLA